MASFFDQAAVRRQLTEHPENAVYAAWTVFDLTADLLLHVFKARLRALGERCFDFQDRTLGIPRHLGFLPAPCPRLAVEMCFYLRLLWMLVTALAILWLVPQDRRHGEILWLWSIPLIGVFVLWGMICLQHRKLRGPGVDRGTKLWVHIVASWAVKWLYRRGQGVSLS